MILSYPNGAQSEITLADVPRVGELIRRKGNGNNPPLLVQQVQWLEGDEIIVLVREEDRRL